jgi:hypothetical protein
MVGLLDIAPSNRVVETSFGQVDVPGLTINALVSIMKRHPEVLDLLKEEGAELGYSQILDLGLDVSASVLAAGLGYLGNADAEERCKALKPEDAFDLGQAVLEESFPSGSQSFFDKVSKALGKLNLQPKPKGTISST